MNLISKIVIALAIFALIGAATFAFADDTIRECVQKDGSVLYTNKAKLGCTDLILPKVSIAPTRTDYLKPLNTPTPDYVVAATAAEDQGGRHDDSVNLPFCDLYSEWLQLSKKTLGGFVNNSVPDTQRRMFLTQIFGSGFPPYNCK
jgi:hypothetical protein